MDTRLDINDRSPQQYEYDDDRDSKASGQFDIAAFALIPLFWLHAARRHCQPPPVLVALLRLVSILVPLLGVTLWLDYRPIDHHAAHNQAYAPILSLPASYPATADYQPGTGATFASWYTEHHGIAWLGPSLTPEVPVAGGRIQIFRQGILFHDSSTGQTATVPVVRQLIESGSPLSPGGLSSSLTYLGLGSVLDKVPPPWWWQGGSDPARSGLYIGTTGHYIPAPTVSWLQGLGDWQTLIGLPLTEALPATIKTTSGIQSVTLQAFSGAIVLSTGGNTPAISLLAIGADDLSVLGPPAPYVQQGQMIWLHHSVNLVAIPTGTDIVDTLPQAATPILTGDAVWKNGMLWYRVAQNNTQGWLTATSIDLDPPPDPWSAITDISALSPDLGNYLNQQGDTAALAVYALDAHRIYSYRGTAPKVMGSTFKIFLLMTLLQQAEQQGRQLTDSEKALCEAMIERSDNDAATAVYQLVGYDTGVQHMLSSLHISDISIDTSGFGYTLVSPLDMVSVIDQLVHRQVLTDADRAYALNLMGHIIPEQQWGLGRTAPAGAQVYMKDGLLNVPNGWLTATVGMIGKDGHAYIAAIYVDGHANSDDGWAVVETICKALDAVLLG